MAPTRRAGRSTRAAKRSRAPSTASRTDRSGRACTKSASGARHGGRSGARPASLVRRWATRSDRALADRLVALGIRADTVEALVLVPLVEVAWADGMMDPREREAVLRAAASIGIAERSPGYDLLEAWTHQRPAPELMESGRSYIRTLTRELSADHRWHLEEQVMGKARAVAEAAGGFLGLAKVSKSEEAVLADLEAAFRS